MNANELMIGDLVMHGFGGIGKITEIDSKTVVIKDDGFDTGDGMNEVSFALNELTPIPLTSEILERNGFKFYCTDVFEEWRSKDKRITIHDEEYPNSFNKWSVHVDTEDMRTMGYYEITYVHELQHALRLCGIDKEITI